MSLRILHILDHSIPLHSGYTFRTAAILREQHKLGWETCHLTSPKHSAAAGSNAPQYEEAAGGLHFHRTAPVTSLLARLSGLGQQAQMRATERRLLEVAAQVKPHILHAHSPVLNAMPALRVGQRLGIPVDYEVRAFWEDAAVDHGTTTAGSLRYRQTHHLETRALRQAQHVFTICEGPRKNIASRGTAADKVSVIPNAVDIAPFEPGGQPDAALKASLGLIGATVVGFIGSFYAYEGLGLLFQAQPALLARHRRLRRLLVGGGPQEAALMTQAQALGLADKVVFTGRAPHAHMQRYYNLIDVLAYPRLSMRLTDLVTPPKPLEAMAQGRVKVASDVGGHRELIEHGHTGWLFKADDPNALVEAICALLKDREQWPQMRRAGREFVERERNWAGSVARCRPVYDSLVGAV